MLALFYSITLLWLLSVISVSPPVSASVARENESFLIDESAYCNDNAGPWWNPWADDEAEVSTDYSGEYSRVVAKVPNSNYFYYESTTFFKGKDADGADVYYSPFAQTKGGQRADFYDWSYQHMQGDGNRDLYPSTTWDYFDVVYDGGYNVDKIIMKYRSARSDAGHAAMLRTFCYIKDDGPGSEVQDQHDWAIWLSKVKATITSGSKVKVDWDWYRDSNFLAYYVYYKHYSSSSWTLGRVEYNRGIQSATLGPFSCYTFYDFKVRLVFNGNEWWDNAFTETYIDREFIATC